MTASRTWEPVPVARVQVVREIDANEHAARGRVDGHVVCRVVQELGASVSLHVVRVEVAPPQLNVDPVLVAASMSIIEDYEAAEIPSEATTERQEQKQCLSKTGGGTDKEFQLWLIVAQNVQRCLELSRTSKTIQ